VRGVNEDRYRWWAGGRLVVLADGMAGRPHGGVAAELALDAIALHAVREGLDERELRDMSAAAAERHLYDFFALAHRAISAMSERHGVVPPMTTTLLAAMFTGDGLVLGHVGDSRGYHLGASTLSRITIDQRRSPPGFADLEPAERDELLSLVCVPSAIVGDAQRSTPVVTRQLLALGDIVLLCSNGLSDVVRDDEIAVHLGRRDSAAECSERLVAAAAVADAEDDATAVVATLRSATASTHSEVRHGR
jgi:serine/threonine protein phosphatase PrpC